MLLYMPQKETHTHTHIYIYIHIYDIPSSIPINIAVSISTSIFLDENMWPDRSLIWNDHGGIRGDATRLEHWRFRRLDGRALVQGTGIGTSRSMSRVHGGILPNLIWIPFDHIYIYINIYDCIQFFLYIWIWIYIYSDFSYEFMYGKGFVQMLLPEISSVPGAPPYEARAWEVPWRSRAPVNTQIRQGNVMIFSIKIIIN